MTTTDTILLHARLNVLSVAVARILEALPRTEADQVRARVRDDFARLPCLTATGEAEADVDAALAGEVWRLLGGTMQAHV